MEVDTIMQVKGTDHAYFIGNRKKTVCQEDVYIDEWMDGLANGLPVFELHQLKNLN
jgi:hypothetical protein